MHRPRSAAWPLGALGSVACALAAVWLWQTAPAPSPTRHGPHTARSAPDAQRVARPALARAHAEPERRAEPPTPPTRRSLPQRAVLPQRSVLAGEIVDPAGSPVGWAELIVTWQLETDTDGAPRTEGRADARGRFRLEPPAGMRPLAAHLEARPPTSGTGLAALRRTVPLPAPNALRLVLPRGVRLEGRVWDAATGAGLPGVPVWVELAEGRRKVGTRTGAGGRFTLEDLDPGRLRVQARSPAGGRSATVELVTRPGERATVALRLERGATAAGRVVRARDDEPLPGARIRAVPAGIDPLDPPPTGGPETETDEAGRFSLAGLDPGPVTLLVEHEHHPPQLVTAHAAPEGAAAPTMIRLPDGARLQVQLQRPPGGEPDGPLTVIARRTGGDFSRSAEFEDGANTVTLEGLPPGPYRVLVLSARGAPIGAARLRIEPHTVQLRCRVTVR
ncbi:MAG: hypothetical protein D6776_03325 [Planctomycetota bacterium]|nr:MAG: hypothetical protein D6776_03325 [Planctomycetota bacterium]